MLMKEFDLAKIYLQEKSSKLARAVKIQDKVQQGKPKKEDEKGAEEPLDKTNEEELDPYDVTLENLMTLENSNASMVTENATAEA